MDWGCLGGEGGYEMDLEWIGFGGGGGGGIKPGQAWE